MTDDAPSAVRSPESSAPSTSTAASTRIGKLKLEAPADAYTACFNSALVGGTQPYNEAFKANCLHHLIHEGSPLGRSEMHSLNYDILYEGLPEESAKTKAGIWLDIETVCPAPFSPRHPHFFLVRATERKSGVTHKNNEVSPEDDVHAMFYSLNAQLRRCPPAYKTLHASLIRSAYHIEKAFACVRESRTFDPLQGFGWEAKVDKKGNSKANAKKAGAKPKQRLQNASKGMKRNVDQKRPRKAARRE